MYIFMLYEQNFCPVNSKKRLQKKIFFDVIKNLSRIIQIWMDAFEKAKNVKKEKETNEAIPRNDRDTFAK